MTSFPTDYTKLPTVSVIAPNQVNDMHHGKDPDRIQTGDRWLQEHLGAYVQWAQQHNSLLIVTWDEDNKKENNRIMTLFVGPMVKAGRYDQRITHYNVLRTIEDLYGLPHSGTSTNAHPSPRYGELPRVPDQSVPRIRNTPSRQTVRYEVKQPLL
jgi:acid phosphatase